MTDREKLINLLKSNQKVLQATGVSGTATLRLADILLAGGVTVRERGWWITQADGTHFCSECGGEALYEQFDDLCFREKLSILCPNCGALLDLEDETESEGDRK